MKYTFQIIIGFFAIALVFSACGSKSEKPEETVNKEYVDARESTTMQRTMTDTLGVLYNTKKYLDFLKEQQLDSAMNMLYVASGDTVLPITEEAKAQVLRTLTMFPVLDYEIDKVQMFSEDNTEVHYTIKYFESDDADANNTLKCVLSAIRVGYYWHLVVPELNRQPNPGNLIDK